MAKKVTAKSKEEINRDKAFEEMRDIAAEIIFGSEACDWHIEQCQLMYDISHRDVRKYCTVDDLATACEVCKKLCNSTEDYSVIEKWIATGKVD